MQWTDKNGRAYGEDPYGDVGYAYAHGYEYGGSAPTDTATMPWDPVELAQWAQPGDGTHAMGPDLHATGVHPYAAGPDLHATGVHSYAAGPDPVATAWDVPPGDPLTVPPPEFDTAGHPVPEPDTPASESVRPVFVDSSGRRQRRVLRAARLLAIPAGGYVALLISTMLGGPSISSPFVPQPDPAHRATPRAAAPDSSPGTAHSAESASPAAAQQKSRPAVQKTPSLTEPSAASTAPAATSGPTGAPAATTPPAATAAPAHTSSGRAVGSFHNPVK